MKLLKMSLGLLAIGLTNLTVAGAGAPVATVTTTTTSTLSSPATLKDICLKYFYDNLYYNDINFDDLAPTPTWVERNTPSCLRMLAPYSNTASSTKAHSIATVFCNSDWTTYSQQIISLFQFDLQLPNDLIEEIANRFLDETTEVFTKRQVYHRAWLELQKLLEARNNTNMRNLYNIENWCNILKYLLNQAAKNWHMELIEAIEQSIRFKSSIDLAQSNKRYYEQLLIHINACKIKAQNNRKKLGLDGVLYKTLKNTEGFGAGLISGAIACAGMLATETLIPNMSDNQHLIISTALSSITTAAVMRKLPIPNSESKKISGLLKLGIGVTSACSAYSLAREILPNSYMTGCALTALAATALYKVYHLPEVSSE